MCQLNQLVPITALIAIILFIFREVIDFLKNRLERKREVQVYKELVGEEIKHNYEVLDSFSSIVDFLVRVREENIDKVRYKIETDRYGNEYVSIKLGDKSSKGSLYIWLKKFQTDQFDNHIPQLAKLDRRLYISLNDIYKTIRHWEKIRNEMVCSLAREIKSSERSFFININLQSFARDKDNNYNILRKAYSDLLNSAISITD